MSSIPSRSAIALCVIPLWSASAFTGLRFPSIFGGSLPANPSLGRFAEAQSGQSLKFRLEIGHDDDESVPHLLIDGLHLELGGAELPKDRRRVPLPGIDGPHPKLSSGPRALRTLNEGMFVDMSGMRTVNLLDGCWELVWREDAPAGSIICAFDHPEEARRNEHSSSLPKGLVYISFPVWTRDDLDKKQRQKAEVMELADRHAEEIESHFQKMKDTSNPLMKALHFRNACAAHEKLSFSGHRSISEIPDDSDVATIGDGLMICRKGTIWTKDGSFFNGNHALLGHATVRPTELKP